MVPYFKKDQIKGILKIFKLDSIFYYLKEKIFINKAAIVVEKDLVLLPPLKEPLPCTDVRLVEITLKSISLEAETEQALIYSNDKKQGNRRLKAAYYLNKGYRGVALVNGNDVLGDIWYVGARENQQGLLHPDMKWLGIKCGVHEAYAFDMYMHPEQRGHNLANLLQQGALHKIKQDGFAKVFGYFWVKNIPALWVHRTLRWKELKRRKLTRCFFAHFYCDNVIDKSSSALGSKSHGFSFLFY